MTISTIEKNKNILKKLVELAKKPSKVNWTERAIRDVNNTDGMTQAGVLESMISHIENGGDVHKTLTKMSPHTGSVVHEMLTLINERERYIKVRIWEKGPGGAVLLIVSAHDPNIKKGE